jgi:hypothetical protein
VVGRSSKYRIDIIAALNGKRYWIDVSYTHPLAPTYLKLSGIDTHKCTAARRWQAVKMKLWAKLASEAGAKPIPFVIETLGSIGPAALSFLRTLAAEAVAVGTYLSVPRFMQHARGSLMKRVWMGNAECVLEATRNLVSPAAPRPRRRVMLLSEHVAKTQRLRVLADLF